MEQGGGREGVPVVLGGAPVHVGQWPAWPRAGAQAHRGLWNVLHSGKWSVSGKGVPGPSQERRFAEAFAEYAGRRHGVACASGSAALTIAFQAIGLAPGDDVVVPGLTWVACASAVRHLGANPVFADVDPRSLCMTPASVEAAMTPRTRAVLGVHMYAARADLAGLEDLCQRRGVILIEDASQAHGASLGKRRTGTFGLLSVFSFQQSKLLTGGEGGIVLTDDPTLYDRLQQLRADGRVYADDGALSELMHKGTLLGRNLVMPEVCAVLLQEGLGRLDVENAHRRWMAARLTEGLQGLGWCEIVRDTLEPADGATFYKIPLRVMNDGVRSLGPVAISKALSHDLGLLVEPLDRPLNVRPQFRPDNLPHTGKPACLPDAEAAWGQCVALPHYCLLGGEPEVEAIVAALHRLRDHADALRAHFGVAQGQETTR